MIWEGVGSEKSSGCVFALMKLEQQTDHDSFWPSCYWKQSYSWGWSSLQQHRLGTFHADERRCCCDCPPWKTERGRAGLLVWHAGAVLVWWQGRSCLCAAKTAGRKQSKLPWHKLSRSAGNVEMEKILISLSDRPHKNTQQGLPSRSLLTSESLEAFCSVSHLRHARSFVL